MNHENKETILNAADALETISDQIGTASELAALVLCEVCERQPDTDKLTTLLNAIMDILDYQKREVLCCSRRLNSMGG